MNFDKYTIRLHLLLIFSILTKFLENQITITILSIKCLNTSFCNLKLYIKYKLIDHIINNILLTQNLTCVLRTQRTCNSMIRLLSKVVVLSITNFVTKLYPINKALTKHTHTDTHKFYIL